MIEFLRLFGGVIVILGIVAGWILIGGSHDYVQGIAVGVGGVSVGVVWLFMAAVLEKLDIISVYLKPKAGPQPAVQQQEEGRPA